MLALAAILSSIKLRGGWRSKTIQTLYEILAKRKLKRQPKANSSNGVSIHQSLLEKLTHYYTACLKYYNPLQYSFTSQDDSYVELTNSPLNLSEGVYEQAVLEIVEKAKDVMVGERLEPYYGTVLVVESKLVNRVRTNTIHPLILYPYRQNGDVLSIDWQMPVVNGAAVALLDNLELPSAMAEAESLTMSFREQVLMEGYQKGSLEWIKEYKPHWEIGQTRPKEYIPLDKITRPGTYQQDILCLVSLSPYTRGLEEELASLINLENLEESALYALLSGLDQNIADADDDPNLLKVLPSNSEQEAAVRSALRDKLSVIQGPPGTGKSQVIAQAVMNAIHDGQTVLFVSKNNQAVDIVEKRINELSNQPLILRIRPGSVRRQVVEFLSHHLNPTGVKSSEQARLFSVIRLQETKLGRAQNRVEEYRKQRSWLVEADEIDHSSNLEGLPGRLLDRMSKLLIKINENTAQTGFGPTLRLYEAKLYKNMLERRGLVLEQDEWTSQMSELIKAEISRRKCLQVQANLRQDSLGNRLARQLNTERRIKNYTAIYWPVYVASRLADLPKDIRIRLEEYRVGSHLNKSKDSHLRQLGELFEYFKGVPFASALPAWSTTLLSLRRTTPLKAALFDVVIFDEASQCDIASALPALARARRAVVIGDPKQLSHITSHTAEHEKALLRSYGLTRKNMRWSYTQNSLFDLVQSSVSVSRINLLRDHHRSHEHIIGFSNKFFYGGMLRPKTKPDKLKLPAEDCGVFWDDTGTSRVDRPESGSARNIKEARRVVKLLERLIDKYPNTTIGIVTPFRAQAELISSLVDEILDEDDINQIELRIGTVHTFQGDEKDIIIFSPVVAEGISEGQTRFIAQAGKLFNVAITRARSKFIVVGDLIYARTNQIQFYSSFVQYIIDFDKTRLKKGVTNHSNLEEMSMEMQWLLRHTSLILSEQSNDGASNFILLDTKSSHDIELVRLESGGRSVCLLIDRMTNLITDSKSKLIEDGLVDLLDDGSLVFSATLDELQSYPEQLLARLSKVLR